MIVLWIILAILACILLLLCFPVGIHLSYWTPKDEKKQTVSYKTEAVDKEIDELELCEGDKEVLRQAVEKLGCYEKEPEKQLTATVRYLFFQIKLYPMKLKQKPEKEEKKKQLKAWKQEELEGRVELLKNIQSIVDEIRIEEKDSAKKEEIEQNRKREKDL